MNRRLLEIDVLKVVGIVTVVLIHGLRSPWDPSVSPLEAWLGHVTRFAVPGFLLCSGLLYATDRPVPAARTRQRLRRVLVPYALASVAAQLFNVVRGTHPTALELLRDFALAASFGPYYYVFVIAVLIAVTPLFARLPPPLLAALTGAAIAAQWVVDASLWFVSELFWHLRNPLLWWAYFLVGWQLGRHHAAVCAWIAPRRVAVGAALGVLAAALTAASAWDGPQLAVRTAAWLNIYATLALLFALSCGRRGGPAWLRVASDGTYAIYLLHLFFLYAARDAFPLAYGRAEWLPILVPWLAGLAGSLATIALLRALLQERSREWIGA